MFHKLHKWISTKETKLSRDKNYQMTRFISLLIAVQGLCMFCISAYNHDYKVAWIPLLYGVIMFGVYFHTTYSQKLIFFYITSTLIVLFLEFNFLIYGGTNGFGIIWILIIPLFSVYLFNRIFFYIINAIILCILIGGMWTPLKQFLYPLDPAYQLRIPIVYIVEFLFGSFLKYRIRKTEMDLKKQKNLLSIEIHQAAMIQKSFFQQHVPAYFKWSMGHRNLPMAGVSGDLYDVYSNGPELNGIGVFDVSGHGISSGLITMLIKNIIYQEFYKDLKCPLSHTIDRINTRFIKEKGSIENYFTAVLVRIIDDTKLELVNAGHQYPLLYKRNNNTFIQIKKAPEAIGAVGLKNVSPEYVSQFVEIEPGDELIIFTDGVTDTINPKGEKFGQERFLESLERHINENPDVQVNTVLSDLKDFQGKAAPTDDVTIMILKKD